MSYACAKFSSSLFYLFRCSGSVLSVTCRSQLVAAGLFNTGIVLFDPRTQDSVGEYSPHRLAITALTLAGKYTCTMFL